MKNENHLSDERISGYLDDELSSSEMTAAKKHLNECERCSSRLDQFNMLQAVARQSPEPVMEDDLWSGIEQELDSATIYRAFFSKHKRWVAAAAVFLVALTGGWMLLNNQPTIQDKEKVTASVNPLSFDFGPYLTGLNEPDQMKRFTDGYNREEVELDYAIAQVNVEKSPDRFQELMKNLPQKTVYLLNSACCKSMQVTVQNRGKTFTIFKQPQNHPIEFSGYKMKHTRVGSTECTMIEAGQYVALTFTTDFAKYVIVGEENNPMLATVVQKLSAKN